jgi:hypothetical protein
MRSSLSVGKDIRMSLHIDYILNRISMLSHELKLGEILEINKNEARKN